MQNGIKIISLQQNLRCQNGNTFSTYTPAQGISPADALWTLIQKASKNTRRAIAERLITSDLEMSEQLLLKASIKRGWEEVKIMHQAATPAYTLQNLIDELKTD